MIKMNYLMKLFMGKSSKWFSKKIAFLPIFLLFFFGKSLIAQSTAELFPPKPSPAVFVHDYAGWLNPNEKDILERKLQRYFDSTTTQIVIMIRPDIGDYDKAGYAFELGNRWGIGRKDKNNGIVLLVKTEAPERGIFIATGYGTEGALPDITAGRIVREVMAPYFRRNQYFGGLSAGTNSIQEALQGEFQADPSEKSGGFSTFLFMFLFFLIMFLILYSAYRRRGATIYDHNGQERPVSTNRGMGGGWWVTGGGWSSGGNGGFGGNSGGDGGGWSGGDFGGGDFGGGGAGGDW
jgi:uncharacterized protein